MSDSNYKKLFEYLHKNNLRILPSEFKAILMTMNSMTSGIKKSDSIKSSSKKFDVTQTFIKNTLKNMGFKGSLEKEANETFSKFNGITNFNYKRSLSKG